MDYMAGSLLPFKRVRVGVRSCGSRYLLPKSTAQNQSRQHRRSPCRPALAAYTTVGNT